MGIKKAAKFHKKFDRLVINKLICSLHYQNLYYVFSQLKKYKPKLNIRLCYLP